MHCENKSLGYLNCCGIKFWTCRSKYSDETARTVQNGSGKMGQIICNVGK